MPSYATGNWIPGSVETLTRMWGEGAPASQIARALGPGYTRSAVLGKVHRLKLAKREERQAPIRPKQPKVTTNSGKGLAFAIARARKEAVTTGVVVSPTEAILGRGPQGAERFVQPIKTIVDDDPVISLLQLTEHTCRWPLGDPREPDFGFCGQPPMAGKQYCERHHARGTTKVRAGADSA